MRIFRKDNNEMNRRNFALKIGTLVMLPSAIFSRSVLRKDVPFDVILHPDFNHLLDDFKRQMQVNLNDSGLGLPDIIEQYTAPVDGYKTVMVRNQPMYSFRNKYQHTIRLSVNSEGAKVYYISVTD